MNKKLRVMMLCHSYMIPPGDLTEPDDPRMKKFRTEYDVKRALLDLGHEVQIVGVDDDLSPIRASLQEWKPDIAFNLLEAFGENAALDYYIVSYLDMVKIPYTGCNPRGLILARDKALSKKILSFHKIRVPRFRVFRWGRTVQNREVRNLPYPMVVKSLIEQGSVGIAQASFVATPEELVERVIQVQEMTGGDAIAEQYIEGRELYVTVMGNQRLAVFPIRELTFGKDDESFHHIATYKVKWDDDYRERWDIDYRFARHLSEGQRRQITHLCKRVYRILDLTSYARMDLRLTESGHIYVLEANPNADIAEDDDVALSAEKAGFGYEQLIQKLLNLGLRASTYN